MPTPIDPETRLSELGLSLPEPAAPVAAYVPTMRTGDLVFVSGQIPVAGGKVLASGAVPGRVSPDQAVELARVCTLNGLAALKAEIGSLDKIRRVVRVGVFVASDPGFGGQPAIANGASELLVEIFGERGKHARAAVGCPSLPLEVPVEIEFLFEVE